MYTKSTFKLAKQDDFLSHCKPLSAVHINSCILGAFRAMHPHICHIGSSGRVSANWQRWDCQHGGWIQHCTVKYVYRIRERSPANRLLQECRLSTRLERRHWLLPRGTILKWCRVNSGRQKREGLSLLTHPILPHIPIYRTHSIIVPQRNANEEADELQHLPCPFTKHCIVGQ